MIFSPHKKVFLMLPTLKEKKRYIAFETRDISFKDFSGIIVSVWTKLFGLFGVADAGLQFIKFNKGKGILRVNNSFVNHARAVFCLADIPVSTIRVSGVLDKLKEGI